MPCPVESVEIGGKSIHNYRVSEEFTDPDAAISCRDTLQSSSDAELIVVAVADYLGSTTTERRIGGPFVVTKERLARAA